MKQSTIELLTALRDDIREDIVGEQFKMPAKDNKKMIANMAMVSWINSYPDHPILEDADKRGKSIRKLSTYKHLHAVLASKVSANLVVLGALNYTHNLLTRNYNKCVEKKDKPYMAFSKTIKNKLDLLDCLVEEICQKPMTLGVAFEIKTKETIHDIGEYFKMAGEYTFDNEKRYNPVIHVSDHPPLMDPKSVKSSVSCSVEPNVTPPVNEITKSEDDALKQFAKAWCDMMLEGHRMHPSMSLLAELLKPFEKELQNNLMASFKRDQQLLPLDTLIKKYRLFVDLEAEREREEGEFISWDFHVTPTSTHGIVAMLNSAIDFDKINPFENGELADAGMETVKDKE